MSSPEPSAASPTWRARAEATIAVMNCNTSDEMTREIAESAQRAAAPGTAILGMQPSWGPRSAEGYLDSFISAAAVLDALATTTEDFDALVMAGFGEHGREGARELLDVPVVDITEAAAVHAMMLGSRYGVVTTLPRVRGLIEDSLATAGMLQRCAAIEATDLPVLGLGEDAATTREAFADAGRRAIAKGADVLCLGCAGFTSLQADLSRSLGVPIVDGVTAAVALAEGLVRLGQRTSKAGPYATPLPKPRPGWPVGGRPAVHHL